MLGLDVESSEFQEEALDALETDPLKGGLVALGQGGLVDEADGLQDVGDVVEAAYLCLQLLLLYVIFRYLSSCLFK